MSNIEKELYNDGERLVPYISHGDNELIRHRSSYVFFYNIINADQENNKNNKISIVDLGFGSGWGSAILSGIDNSQVTGVDVGEECKIYAEQHYARKNVKYIIKDAKEFVSKMETHDYVVSRGVLEHIVGGLELINEFKYKERIIIDVPYNEAARNSHHLILGITEKNFENFENYEIFYEDIHGGIYKDYCPSNANMMTVVISNPKLKKVSDMFEFPILPVINKEKEYISEVTKKNTVQWLEKDELMPVVIDNIQPVLIGLDIGVGIVPHDYLKSVVYVCCEPYQEYVNVLTEKIASEKNKIYVVQQRDWEQGIADLDDKSVDSVYLIDVIEHLSKEEGEILLKKTERVVRKQIVIFTPLGLIKQEVLADGKDAWGLNGASYQEHKSGWLPEDFDETWNIFACKDFHSVNNIGKKTKDPVGAFWAIKNLNRENDPLDLLMNFSSLEIRDALLNRLPYTYFKIVNEFDEKKIQFQQLQLEYDNLQISHQNLQHLHNNLMNSMSVKCGNKIKKYLRKFGFIKS